MRTIHLFPRPILTQSLTMLCSPPPLAQPRQLGILHGQILHDTGTCRDCRFCKTQNCHTACELPRSNKALTFMQLLSQHSKKRDDQQRHSHSMTAVGGLSHAGVAHEQAGPLPDLAGDEADGAGVRGRDEDVVQAHLAEQ